MKRRFWAISEFIPISARFFSPLAKGGLGGGPGGTMAWYAGPELLGLAELPAWPSMLVMPCPPPLTPPSQGGKRCGCTCRDQWCKERVAFRFILLLPIS